MSQQVYQIVTDRILALLEEGVVPWKRPWRTTGRSIVPPSNLVSRKAYRGINLFLLSAQGFGSAYWLTFRQARERGCPVRRGERGTPIVFWRVDRQGSEDSDGEGEATESRRFFLRYYTVFNVEQCEGMNVAGDGADDEASPPFDPIPACEAVYANMPHPPELCHGGEHAFYDRNLDLVQLPSPRAFSTPEHYFSTQLHELAHATGHASRLNRFAEERPGIFGSPAYAREELVAEMTAAMICGVLGIAPVKVEAISSNGEEQLLESSAAYINHWMEVLKADSRAVVIAAARAQKAADYILGRQSQQEDPVQTAAPGWNGDLAGMPQPALADLRAAQT